jgi:starch-binding outer membrane protein, SusD/RagB family
MMNKTWGCSILVVGAVIAIGGCSDIIGLDEEPTDFISLSNFYRTAGDAQAAINGIYSGISLTETYSRDYPRFLSRWTQEAQSGSGTTEYRLAFDPTVRDFEDIWGAHYAMINRANGAVRYIPDIDMDGQLKRRLLGEAHFLRALLYFNLVRWYGGVPLQVEPTESHLGLEKPRASLSETYALIVDDLQVAVENLPITNADRATEGAAKALLAKVYLTMAGHPLQDRSKLVLAREQLLDLVDPANPAVGRAPYNYALEPNFADLWWQTTRRNTAHSEFAILSAANETGPESVFSIRFTTMGTGGGSVIAAGWNNQTGPWLGNLFEANEQGSYRSVHTLNPAGSNWGPTGGQRKFQPTENANNNQQHDWPYLRFADVILMFAEVENELDGPTAAALTAINAVRERARTNGGTNVGQNDVSNYLQPDVPADYTPAEVGSQEAFRNAVYLERQLELAMEGQAWFDWLRTGRLEEMITMQGRNYQPRIELFPIPRTEIDLSRGIMEQNPGY